MTLAPPVARRDFATATAVTSLGDGTYAAELDEGWRSLIAIHGGYTVAVAVRAILDAFDADDQVLRTVSARFVRAPQPGPATVRVAVERKGRSLSFTSARVEQERGATVLVEATFATPIQGGLEYADHRAPRRTGPRPAGLDRFDGGGLVHHFENIDLRLDPEVIPFSGQGRAWLGAWLRPLEGDAYDLPWLVAAGDVLPPASFSRTDGPTRAATLDYTLHLAVADPLAHLPAGASIYLETWSDLAADGLAVEDGVLWAPDGTIVAVMRQTRLGDATVPRSMRPASQ